MPQAYPVWSGLARGSPTPGLTAGSPVRRTSLSHCHSSDDDGISTDTSISDKPPCRSIGAEEVEVTRVVVTPMRPAPLEGGERKRMDFLAGSKSLNFGARRDILMMWPMPLGSGPTVSLTNMITMRIPTSCPWWCLP